MTSAAGQTPQRWGARRWVLVVALVFTVEVSLVVALSWRPGESLPAPPRQTTLRFVTDAALNRRLQGLEWMPDPARFATPGPRGFTADLWRPTPPPNLPWSPRTEPPRWLEQRLEKDGELTAFSVESPWRAPRVGEYPPPVMPLVRIEGPALPSRSLLNVEGDLTGWRVVSVGDLPVWPLEDVLPPSVVQVVVGPEGSVLSVILQPPGSGLAAADARALELAREVRFEALPVGRTGLTWGRLVFRWATVLPPPPEGATNTPPGS